MSLALKDRAAISWEARRADAVYWFDRDLPGFICRVLTASTRRSLVQCHVPGYMPGSAEWRPAPTSAGRVASRHVRAPRGLASQENTTYGGTFPHPVKSMKALTYSPLAQDLVLDFAQHLIVTENLGTGETADVLFVGITPTDYVGHYYGPDSMEVADNFVRLDRSLAHFLDALERRFGDRVLVALTAITAFSRPRDLKLRDPKRTPAAGPAHARSNATRISDLRPRHRDRAQPGPPAASPMREAPLAPALVYFFESPVSGSTGKGSPSFTSTASA